MFTTTGSELEQAWRLDLFRLLHPHLGFPKKDGSNDRRRFSEFWVSCTFSNNKALIEFDALPKPGRRESPKDIREYDIATYSAAKAVEDLRADLLPPLRQRIAAAQRRRARPF
ncbi:MAG TPA: hypothetical protein VGF98_04915 [Candidatus Tumulicola sp.]|jgi:hypothetical protein